MKNSLHKKIGVGLLVAFTVMVVLLELYVKNMAEYRVQDNMVSETEGTSALIRETEEVSKLTSESELDKLVSKAEEAKISFLRNKEFAGDFMFPEEDVRYQEAYVNGDDIPELFLCQGNGHVDNVLLYSYYEAENAYLVTGEFSEYGKVSYLPRTGHIRSMYGGMGCFYWATFKWYGDKDFELIHSCAGMEKNYGKELYLYENYPVPVALIDPELECHGEWAYMQEEYRVSELSCEDEDDEFIKVSYDEMKKIEAGE